MANIAKETIIFDSDCIGINDIVAEADRMACQVNQNGIFTIRTGNQWLEAANKRPAPNALYLCLWFEGELCILYADTNLGKSIMAVQIANDISKQQPVIYFDFELSDKQFEYRYSSNYTNHYQFNDNFYRAEINPDAADYQAKGFTTIEDYLNQSIEQAITSTGSKVIIIDNITYLRSETEKAKDALPLMKHLKSLKQKYGLSILCLAHTPKRDMSKPITRNDLQGSKMLMNFCDSSFAIGESNKDRSTRYIKQIKERHSEKIYDADNVIEYRIMKETNYLHFEFTGYGAEHEHLRIPSEKDKEQRESLAVQLHSKGIPNVAIARQLNVSEGAVRKWLKKAEEKGSNEDLTGT